MAFCAAADAQAGTAERADNRGLISFETEAGETLTIRLAGIEFPRPGAPGHGLAMRVLDETLRNHPSVELIGLNDRQDRYGNLIADFELGNMTLANVMVGSGFAMAYSWSDMRQGAEYLLSIEGEARAARRGLWEAGIFAIRTPDPNTLALYLETVQIVEGRVISVSETRERTYLNFGFDYRTDFTVSIAARDVSTFTEAGLDLASLEGRIIRVRGWVGAINGPSMTIDHPERIEVLTP